MNHIRSMCPVCQSNLLAINYVKDGKVYYRSKCHRCQRLASTVRPHWMRSGYRKKPNCEKCGFKSKFKEQLTVYHIDGKLSNTHPTNLKTVCKNCEVDIDKSKLGWRIGDLVPDF